MPLLRDTKTKFAVFILLACIIFGSSGSAQPSEPYIYYYSSEAQAFIIERVDGSEQEILTPYALPEGYLSIYGAGWSPSKQFFTWITHPLDGLGPAHTQDIFIFNTAEEIQEIIHPEAGQGFADTIWSPANDLLLILSLDTRDVVFPIISIYDPNQKAIIFTYTFSLSSSTMDAQWSPNGEYISLSKGGNLYILNLATLEITEITADFSAYPNCDFGTLPQWLSDNEVLYPSSLEELTRTNIETGESSSISFPENIIEIVDWSPDRQYALIYTQSQETENYQLYLFSSNSNSSRLINNNVFLHPRICNESAWGNNQRATFISSSGELQLISIEEDVVVTEKLAADVSKFEWTEANHLIFSTRTELNSQFEIYDYDSIHNSIESLSENLSLSPSIYDFSVQAQSLFFGGALVDLNAYERINLIPSGELLLEPTRTDYVRWHPSGNWLFLLSNYNYLYHVKVASIEGFVASEIALCPLKSLACFGWLPN